MNQLVKVTVTGVHTHPGVRGEEETRTVSSGQYRLEDGAHTVEYEEYMDGDEVAGASWTGGVATYNRVTITPQFMQIVRKGSVESTLRFQEGVEFLSEYKTAYGAMKSRIHTKRYAMYTLEKGNRLIAEAEYTVSMNGMEMSETLMRIEVV